MATSEPFVELNEDVELQKMKSRTLIAKNTLARIKKMSTSKKVSV